MSNNITFSTNEIYNLEKFVMRGGSKTILPFSFEDEFDDPLDITSSAMIWTLSEFGQPDFTILTKQGITAGDYGFNIVLESSDTKKLEGKFVQQVTLIDYLGEEFIPAQGIVKINRNNNNDA